MLPASSAGATFVTSCWSGKFHGVIAPTTPTGSRTTREVATSSVHGKSVAAAIVAVAEMTGRAACAIREKVIGAPISAVMVAAISSVRACRPSQTRRRTAARSAGAVEAQPGSAAAAAATARSTSAAVPAGTAATTAPVAGLRTSITGPEAGTGPPPIQWAAAGKTGSLCGELFMPPRSQGGPGPSRDRVSCDTGHATGNRRWQETVGGDGTAVRAPRATDRSGRMDRAALADFLRTRRQGLQPEDVGLPRGRRRRTGGLRREEVAELSSVSTDYYSRIEQRRGPRPSERVLAALAGGLRLSPDERDHLFRLAGYAPRGGPPTARVPTPAWSASSTG